jgi:hypothetical protein
VFSSNASNRSDTVGAASLERHRSKWRMSPSSCRFPFPKPPCSDGGRDQGGETITQGAGIMQCFYWVVTDDLEIEIERSSFPPLSLSDDCLNRTI